MVFVPYSRVLSAPFLTLLAAAVPMAPVNMRAIRRGMSFPLSHTETACLFLAYSTWT